MSEIRIREATAADAGEIAQVSIESWQTTYAGIVPRAALENLDYAGRKERWAGRLNAPGMARMIAVAENAQGRIVGFAQGGPERGGDPDYRGELYSLYLVQAYQAQGIGRRLVSWIARRLLAEGFDSMLVWALRENPACRFYERLGGRFVRDDLFEMGGELLTEVAYGWEDIRPLVAMAFEGNASDEVG